MKKFYISLFLFVVSAFCVNIDARWDIGDIKAPSEIQSGDTVAIEYCASSARIGRYLAGGFIAPLGIIDENCAWVVEDGPTDMRTGAPTFYFRQVSTNLYIGTNGSTFGNEAFNMAEDQMSAANFQIISYGEPIPWANRKPTWRTNEPWEWTEDYKQGDREKFDWEVQGSSQATKEYSVAFTFSSGSNIDDFKYLANWSNDNVAYWQYCSTIEWNVYDISYVHDKMSDLANLIAQYENFQPLAGDLPGLYSEDAVNYYTEVLITAYMIANTPGLSDEEYDKAMADLTAAKEACEASQVPITDGGYYYIVSGYADYLAEQGSENALYPRDGFVGYSNFTGHEIDPKFVWKFTKADDYQDWQGWNIQSLLNEQYIGRQSSDYGVQRPMVDENDNPQYLKIQADALWFITDRTSGTKVSLQCGVAAGKVDAANDKEGKCWGYWVYGENPMTYPDAKNLWYIRPVPAEVMAQIEDAKKQSLRNEELKNLANSAKDIYEKLFVLNAPMKEKLIVNADEETGQITCNAGRTEGTKFVNLIDSDSLTYLHTDGGYTLAPHHFQFDISDNPQSAVTFVYDRRRGAFDDPKLSSITGWGIDESPAYVSIYVTNDTTNGGEWKQIVNNLYVRDIPYPVTLTYDFHQSYKYIRFVEEINKRGDNMFTLSEFQIFKAEEDKENSQYYSTAGMSDVAEALLVAVAKAEQIVALGNTTEQDIADMQDAINAVNNLYADPEAFKALIDECRNLKNNITIGDEIGELPKEKEGLLLDLNLYLQVAEQQLELKPNKNKYELFTKELTSIKNDIYSNIKFIEEDKWYFIANADITRTGQAGSSDSYCNSNIIYTEAPYNDSKIKWGYYDFESSDLIDTTDPKTMWTFKKVEGTEYYYIQNMYSGIYMGEFSGNGEKIVNSPKPVPYKISILGNKQFSLCPVSNKNKNNIYGLYAGGGEHVYVICGKAEVNTPGAWTFTEITEEITDAIIIKDFAMNLTDVFAVPFNHEDLAELNDDCHWYRIKKLNTNEKGDFVSVELTEGTSFEAGESSIYIGGDIEDGSDAPYDNELYIPMPTTVVAQAWSGAACNGILGQIHGDTCPAGSGVSDGKKFFQFTSDSGVGALTGVINPKDYQGEKEDWTTDVILEFKGVLTGTKSVKKNAKTILKSVVGVSGVVGNSVVPGVYVTEDGKKVVE